MKGLNFLFFLLMILSCGCISKPVNQKSELIQICLDEMYKNTNFRYLEKLPLILIENKYSEGLRDIHFGQNKVSFKHMSLPQQHAVLGNLTDKDRSYFIIDYFKIESDKAEVSIGLPMLTLQIPLKKAEKWTAQGITVITDDDMLTPPPHKKLISAH